MSSTRPRLIWKMPNANAANRASGVGVLGVSSGNGRGGVRACLTSRPFVVTPLPHTRAMPNEYVVSISRSAVRLERRYRWAEGTMPPRRGGGTNAGGQGHGPSTAGRVVRDFSMRSRNNMRWQLSALEWEALGPRPAMISLTYPADWRLWAGSGPVVRAHREALKERWRREFGESIRGAWVREFQRRGAPHHHMYVGLPASVTEDDYEGLVRRTRRRRALERRVGKYQARRLCGPLRGEFAEWLLGAWAGCVGTAGLEVAHEHYGADVAPFFWGDAVAQAQAGEVNWGRIAEYLWRESGKWGQKQVPEGFADPGRWWGMWGVRSTVSEAQVSEAVAMEFRRLALRLLRARATAAKRAGGFLRVPEPRGRDGLTVFDLDRDTALRLLEWAQESALAKTASARRVEAVAA